MASGSDSDHMYCLNVTLKVKPDRRDEFLECIKANQVRRTFFAISPRRDILTPDALVPACGVLAWDNNNGAKVHLVLLGRGSQQPKHLPLQRAIRRPVGAAAAAAVPGGTVLTHNAACYVWAPITTLPVLCGCSAGFEAHTQAPHFKKWEEFAATAPLTESPTLCFFYDDAPAGSSSDGLAAAKCRCTGGLSNTAVAAGAVAAVLAAAFAISKALK